MNNKKTAIVIGASGFVGRHILKHLEIKGYDVYALLHKRDIDIPEERKIRGGIRALTTELIDTVRPEAIYHCARPSFPLLRRTGRMIAGMMARKYNRKLIAEMKASDSKPLLVFSSGSLLYGNSGSAHKEDQKLAPISYARQYYRGEIPFMKCIEKGDYPISLFRLPWLLGPASWFAWFYLGPMERQKAIPLFGAGENIMEIIDIRDAAELMIRHAEAGHTGTINIPGASAVSQMEFCRMVCGLFDVECLDHHKIFSSRLEKEALEAFESNILLESRYEGKITDFSHRDVKASLKEIKDGTWDRP